MPDDLELISLGPWDDAPSSAYRLRVPSRAFEPFPSDTFRVGRRLQHTGVDDRPGVVRQLVAQALEEQGRSHLLVCISPGVDCDECFWLSKAIAAARAGGWLRGAAAGEPTQ